MSTPPTRGIRVFRYAVLFDGVDDYAVIQDIDLTEFTVEVYFTLNQVSWPSPLWRPIVSKGYHTNAMGVGGLYILTPTYATCFLRDVNGNTYSAESSIPNLLFTWRHIVITSEASLYIDSSLIRRVDVTAPINSNNYPWTIGRDPIETVRIIPRSHVSVVRMYSRVLTVDEIRRNMLIPENPVRDRLVVWLHAHPDHVKDIDGDGILEWVDLSGNNNHAKLYGAALATLIKPPLR